jgi:phosphatidylglycerol:prolipoprotein diacylglycerol transferase
MNLGSFPIFFAWMSLVWCLIVFFVYKKSSSFQFNCSSSSSSELPNNAAHALNFILLSMISGLLGARLMHVLWEGQSIYFAFDQDSNLSVNWIRILRFWDGGFVFFGGFILAFICCTVYCRLHKLSFLVWADFFAPILALGYALGRIGCFLNGCCYGKACSLPWSINGLHPTALYAFSWDLGLFFVLSGLERSVKIKIPGSLFFTWMLLHGIGRFLIEEFRGDFRGDFLFSDLIDRTISLVSLDLDLSFSDGISISQTVSLCMIITSMLFLFQVCFSKKNKKHF